MQHLYDPNLHVATREERGLDVKDITGGGGRSKRPRQGLPPSGMPERVGPIRPRVMEYDIINPTGTERLRMSGYGKNVMGSRERPHIQM